MEKRGVIEPGLTPREKQAGAQSTPDNAQTIKKNLDDRLKAIRELDGDFRKLAANSAKNNL